MRSRGVRQNALLALAGDVASKGGALAVVVVAARLLSVSEFAVLAAGLAAAGILGALLDLGAGTLLTRDGAASRTRRGALFGSLLRARAPLAVGMLVLAPVAGLLAGRPLTGLAIAALGISGALSLSVLGVLRSRQDIRPEAIQKLTVATLSIGAVVAAGLVAPRADVVLGLLALVMLVTLLPLLVLVRSVADVDASIGSLAVLRLAAPIGMLALATVAYYRSGTLALAAIADPTQTAMFGIASGVAFGLLMLPNAFTTALLPKLAAEEDFDSSIACSRRALRWTAVAGVLLAAAAAVVAPVGMPVVLGPEYRGAALPFAVLCLGIPLIAASGVIGVTLLSVGRLRPLAVQVAASLAVNLIALALLVPVMGAVGAALATVACEIVGLAVLVAVARNSLPGLITLRASAFPSRPQPSGATVG